MSNTTKNSGRGKNRYITAGDMKIEILPIDASQKYLGRQLNFERPHEAEIENRLKAAWRKFHTFKEELTNKRYSLNQRLRLFEGIVSPTALYGCSCWTLTKKLENQLRGCQRKMLRIIFGSGRRAKNGHEIETWVDWIKRTTSEIESKMRRINIEDWIAVSRRRKYRWAARVASLDESRWAKKAAHWAPHEQRSTYKTTFRRRGRPAARWSDDLNMFCRNMILKEQNWQHVACDEPMWMANEAVFVRDDWRKSPFSTERGRE